MGNDLRTNQGRQAARQGRRVARAPRRPVRLTLVSPITPAGRRASGGAVVSRHGAYVVRGAAPARVPSRAVPTRQRSAVTPGEVAARQARHQQRLAGHRQRVQAKVRREAIRQGRAVDRGTNFHDLQRAALTQHYSPEIVRLPYADSLGRAHRPPTVGHVTPGSVFRSVLHATGYDFPRVGPTATGNLLAHPSRTLRGVGHFANERTLAATVPGYHPTSFPNVNPAKSAYALGVVGNEVRKGNLRPLGLTLKDIGVYAATAPAGVVQAAADPAGAYKQYTSDLNRRYGGSYHDVYQRVKKHGAAPEAVDLATVVGPSAMGIGRGVARAGEAGAFGEPFRRFVAAPRPDLRVSGNRSRPQALGRSVGRIGLQRLEDRRRAAALDVAGPGEFRGRVARRAVKRGRGVPGLKPRTREQLLQESNQARRLHGRRARQALASGDERAYRHATSEVARAKAQHARALRMRPGQRAEVVPLSTTTRVPGVRGRALRIADSEVQTPLFQRYRDRRHDEITGTRGSAIADLGGLSQHERLGVTLAVEGAVPLDAARAVPWLKNLRESMLAKDHQRRVEVAVKAGHSPAEAEAFASRPGPLPQGVQHIDRILQAPEKVFTKNLQRFQERAVARGGRISATDRELKQGTGLAAARRSQQAALDAQGVSVTHPYDALAHEFDSGARRRAFTGAKRDRARAQGRVRAAERKLATARRRESYRQGRAEGPVRAVDRKLLRTQDDYRQAAHELSQAQQELRGARQAFGNAARNPKLYSTDELTASLRRRHVAEARVEATRRAYRRVRAEAEQRLAETYGRQPPRPLASLERAGGRTLERSQALDRARQQLHAADEAVKQARHDKSPKARRALEARKGELDRQFAAVMDAAAREHGLPEAAYVKDYKHRSQVESRAPRAQGGATAAPNLRQSKQRLFPTGRADLTPEAYLQSLHESIKRQANHDLIEERATVHALPAPGPDEMRAVFGREVNGDRMTWDQWLQVFKHRGEDPSSYAPWAPGVFRDAMRKAETDAGETSGRTANDLYGQQAKDAVDASFSPGPRVQGTYAIPREIKDEISRHSGLAGRGWDKFMGIQAGALLGLSPTWAQFQIAANAFLTGLHSIGSGNALAIVKSPMEWKAFSPETRQYAEELFGTGSGSAHAHQSVRLGSMVDEQGIIGWSRAWQEAAGIRYRGLKAQVPGLRHLEGNPLFQLDNAQNRFFKKVVFTSEVKRLAWEQMSRDAGTLNTLLARLSSVFTLGPAEQMRRVVENPDLLDQVMRTTDDVLGNYVRYTSKERSGIRHFVLFYGFMRYAMRTLFYTAPVHHPIMSSIILKLDQLHKDEVDRLFGGHALPWSYGRIFFGSHSPLSMLHIGQKVPGSSDMYSIDLGRMAPTQSPITDIGTEGIKAIPSTFLSPLAQSLMNQFYGKDLFTNQNLRYGGKTEDPKGGIPLAARIRMVLNDAGQSLAPYREAEKFTQPYKTTPDTLLGSPRPVRYKDKALRAEQRKRMGERPNPLEALLGATVAAYPKLDTGRDTVRRQKVAAKHGGRGGGGGSKGGNDFGFPKPRKHKSGDFGGGSAGSF